MLRWIAILGAAVIVLAAIPVSYFGLKNYCSLQQHRQHEEPNGASTGEQHAPPKGEQPNPAATFDLRVTDFGKIEGSYYAKDKPKEKEDWTEKFWCDAKIGEFALVVFTCFLVIFTGGLWFSTHRLWGVTKDAAGAAFRQANAMVAIESPIASIRWMKIVEYANEVSRLALTDPVTRGMPDFFRILVLVENKGRTGMQIREFCCDWIVAAPLPEFPEYHTVMLMNDRVEKEDSSWLMQPNGIRLTSEQKRQIASVDAFLWAYGYFTYANFMGEEFVVGYVGRWDIDGGRFVREPLANYEYNRAKQ